MTWHTFLNLQYKEHNRPRLSVGLGLVGNLQGGEKKNGSDQTDQHTVERKPGKLWSNLKRKAESLPAVKELKTKLASYGY